MPAHRVGDDPTLDRVRLPLAESRVVDVQEAWPVAVIDLADLGVGECMATVGKAPLVWVLVDRAGDAAGVLADRCVDGSQQEHRDPIVVHHGSDDAGHRTAERHPDDAERHSATHDHQPIRDFQRRRMYRFFQSCKFILLVPKMRC